MHHFYKISCLRIDIHSAFTNWLLNINSVDMSYFQIGFLKFKVST